MEFTIPIYIEERKEAGRTTARYSVRPLFLEKPLRRGEQLQRASNRLAGDLRQELLQCARRWRHDRLIEWTRNPELEESELRISLRLKRASAETRFLVVSFPALGRRIAFTPAVPGLWFEVRRGQDLKTRATEVLTRHFRELEKKGDAPISLDRIGLQGKARVGFLELNVPIAQATPAEERSRFALLGGERKMSGSEELENVGRSLNALYPDELDRATQREAEIAELSQLLNSDDRRPILLLGPRKAGKTAIIHETVHRSMTDDRRKYGSRNQVWLLSPQRLISGMMYVGQWEERLLAILDEAESRDHVLYFDDPLGLFQAGRSASSSLCAAQAMKPHLERRAFRLLAEMSPGQFRRLRETDRAFADLFHVIPVRETTDRETRRILLEVQRNREDRHGCRFELDVIPAIFELQRRYAGDQAFPGKAVGFLNQIASRHRGGSISRDTVLADFHETTGLPRSFLDARQRLCRQEITKALALKIVGQPAPLEALADAISLAKARLNDPARPICSLLFLGPTGVGKTQCAKAAAAYLFGRSDRLLRFDMNEYVDGESVARLTGTFREPEGLLTSAVRRQPYCVLLFDEIEKAHPAVFDTLLAVLGEGRLTDALGRTANFANCVIILTSNLGVRESRSRPGFKPDDADAAGLFTDAAEKFFRPEFFNRLDRIVPFAALAREHVENIARELIAGVFARDGLRQRRCALDIHEAAMSLLIDKGYHPQLGARALKRVIERRIAQPLGARIAALAPGAPMMASLYPRGEEITTRIQPLLNAPRLARPALFSQDAPDDRTAEAMLAALERIETRLDAMAPETRVALDSISEEQRLYFALREQFKRVESLVHRQRERAQSQPLRRMAQHPRQPRREPRRRTRCVWAPPLPYKHLASADRLQAALDELSDVEPLEETGDLLETCHELALLDLLAAPAGGERRVALAFRVARQKPSFQMVQIFMDHFQLFDRLWGVEPTIQGRHGPEALAERNDYCLRLIVAREPMPLIELTGSCAPEIARAVEGTHLILQRNGEITPIQLPTFEPAGNQDARDAWQDRLNAQSDWSSGFINGSATEAEEPLAVAPIVRRYEENGPTLDLRSGLISRAWPGPRDLRAFLLSQLPLPAELNALEGTS